MIVIGADVHKSTHALAAVDANRGDAEATIGDVQRFATADRLVGYLGLDPRSRQSGAAPAGHGRISKQGSSAARHVLVEAAWAAIKTPGHCGRSTSVSVHAAARRSRSSPSHGSSPSSAGSCSPASRTTPTSVPATSLASYEPSNYKQAPLARRASR